MKKSALTSKQVNSVPCPTCEVSAGKRCILQSGGFRLQPHVDRKLKAIEKLERN